MLELQVDAQEHSVVGLWILDGYIAAISDVEVRADETAGRWIASDGQWKEFVVKIQ